MSIHTEVHRPTGGNDIPLIFDPRNGTNFDVNVSLEITSSVRHASARVDDLKRIISPIVPTTSVDIPASGISQHSATNVITTSPNNPDCAEYLATIDAIFTSFNPPPPWPDYTQAWIDEARRFRDALLALKHASGFPPNCLVFNGRHTSSGVGYLLGRRRRIRGNYWRFSPTHHNAQHVAWQVDTGEPLPQGMALHASCSKNDCINPSHLSMRQSRGKFRKQNPLVNFYDFLDQFNH